MGSIDEYLEIYREKLNHAVKVRVQSNYPLGSEISGGLDSGTVTAYAALNYNCSLNDMHTFGFAQLEYEPSYILQVNQKYSIPNSYINCNMYQAFNNNHSNDIKVLGYPVEHGNATGHEIFYKKCAQNNVRTLLSGFGGDEFVTTIHCDLVLYELLNLKNMLCYFKVYGEIQ